MQRGQWSEVTAIASRDLEKARASSGTAGHPESLRFVRGSPRRRGHRRHLQSAAESSARAMEREGGRAQQARALRKAGCAYGGRGPATPGRAQSHGRENPGSIHGPHAPSVAGGQGTRCKRSDWRAAIHAGSVQLHESRSRQHPKSAGFRRRRADGHRLLSRQHVALHLRPRAAARHRSHRARPRHAHRSADINPARLWHGTRRWHVQHADGALSTACRFLARRAASSCRFPSTPHPTGPTASSSTPVPISLAAAGRASKLTPATSTQSRAIFSRRPSSTAATCPVRSKTP